MDRKQVDHVEFILAQVSNTEKKTKTEFSGPWLQSSLPERTCLLVCLLPPLHMHHGCSQLPTRPPHHTATHASPRSYKHKDPLIVVEVIVHSTRRWLFIFAEAPIDFPRVQKKISQAQ